MEFGPDDLVMLGLRYVPSLVVLLVVVVLGLSSAAFARKRSSSTRWWVVPLFGSAIAPLVWITYVASTLGSAYTLTLLNSESAKVAERIYRTRFKSEVTTIGQAIALARSPREAPNVRFYASCLLADMLVTSNESVITTTLRRLDGVPEFQTQFIGGNTLTERFHTPGRMQPTLTARGIVEQRLRDLRAHPG